MRNPDYISFFTKDFYIEPVSIEEGNSESQQNIIVLPKGKPVLYGPLEIVFKQFDLSSHNKEGMMGSAEAMTIGAVMEIKTGKDIQTLTPVTTFNMRGKPEMKTAYLKNGNIGFQLVSMNVASAKGDKSTIHVNVVGLEGMAHGSVSKPETLIAEVSVKPFMNLVWISAGLIIGGLFLAMIRRMKQNKV
jgi:hypothetical protein